MSRLGEASLIADPASDHIGPARAAMDHILPIHPIPRMQNAFEKSILDFTDPAAARPKENLDAAARRNLLLNDAPRSAMDPRPLRWSLQPGSRHHTLWKLVSQIAFGVHLLHQQSAKSIQEVVSILQAHIDDIDDFLDDTDADLDLAIRDLDQRNDFLRLPLQHIDTFDDMLADAPFRSDLLQSNKVIERILSRSISSNNASLRDVQEGFEATMELTTYLNIIGTDWTRDDEQLLEVYKMMQNCAEEWIECFRGAQIKSQTVSRSITQLQATVARVSQHVDVARAEQEFSNIALHPHSSVRYPSHKLSQSVDSTRSTSSNLNKPLPPMPSPVVNGGVVAASHEHRRQASHDSHIQSQRYTTNSHRRVESAPGFLASSTPHSYPAKKTSTFRIDVEDDVVAPRVAVIATSTTPKRISVSGNVSRSTSVRRVQPNSPPLTPAYAPRLTCPPTAHELPAQSDSDPSPAFVASKDRASSLDSIVNSAVDSAYSSGCDATPPRPSLAIFSAPPALSSASSTAAPAMKPGAVFTKHTPVIRIGSVPRAEPLCITASPHHANTPSAAFLVPRLPAHAAPPAMPSLAESPGSDPSSRLDSVVPPPRLKRKSPLKQRSSMASLRNIFGVTEKRAAKTSLRGAGCFS